MTASSPLSSFPVDGLAEAWLARLSSPQCTNADRAAFEDWLAESPANVDAYLEVEAIHARARQLASDDLLRAATRRARRSIASDRQRLLPRLATAAALAASLVLAIGIYQRPKRPPTVPVLRFVTTVGEQRSVTLADGTAIRLDTDSLVNVRFAADERVVEVDHGRVQFKVGADPRRPFLVRAGSGTVRDIGTTFQVSHVDAEVRVGLIEGAVMVSAHDGTKAEATLAAGEQIRIDSQGRLHPKQPLDLAVAQAWPQGELIFKERRLDQLLEEMNRYSRTRLRVADPALGAMTVSGVFHIDDQPALVAALEQGWGIRAERVGADEILLSKARHLP
jgi:transmembrane sensor